jgi:integrase
MSKASPLTLSRLIEVYLHFAVDYYVKRYHNGEIRQTNELRMIQSALGIVHAKYGQLDASQFGPKALKACRDAMIAKGWCRTNINRQTERIKRMFKWAAGEEHVPGSVYEALRCVAGLKFGRTKARESHKVKPVEDADVAATLPYLPEVVADMVRFQQFTGCRPGEVCMLRPMDVDRSGPVWVYRPESHKTEHHGRERTIFIGPEGQAVLRVYLERRKNTYCFRPCDTDLQRRMRLSHVLKAVWATDGMKVSNSDYVARRRRKRAPLIQPPGQFYNNHSYCAAIRRACELAGVPLWSPNRLRHAFATKVRKKHGLEAAQVLLGHSKADVTQVYAERDLRLAESVANEIG